MTVKVLTISVLTFHVHIIALIVSIVGGLIKIVVRVNLVRLGA